MLDTELDEKVGTVVDLEQVTTNKNNITSLQEQLNTLLETLNTWV